MGINMQNDINTVLYEEIEKLLIKFNLSENERKTFAYKLTYNCKSFMGTAVYEWTPKCADLTVIEGGDLLVSLREANYFAQNVFIEENIEDIKSKVRNHFKEITVKTILFLFEVKIATIRVLSVKNLKGFDRSAKCQGEKKSLNSSRSL